LSTIPGRNCTLLQAIPGFPGQWPTPPANRPATLLLVDDEPIILDILREVLAPTGHRIITATNGREALDLLPQDPPDLILLDLMMPEIDGFEVCRRVKTSEQWWTIPIIVFTALDQPEDYERAIDCGADDFMSKPLNETILLARVRGYLRAKQTMATLQQSEEYTRMIIDTALDAVVTIDAASMITTWNAQAELIFGWPRQEAVGQSLISLIMPPRFREAHARGVQQFMRTGKGTVINTRTEIVALHRSGREFPVELSITPVRVGDTYIFNAFIRDVTARQEAEQALREAKEEAESANQAKSLFLANISHELRTPMHGILGFSSLGIESVATATPEKLSRCFQQIEKSGHTLLALLNDLLDLAKLESGKMTVAFRSDDLGQLTTSVVEEFRAWADERKLTLDWDRPSDQIEAVVDTEKIKQVLRNLLSNAVKFSPEGSTISIAVRVQDRCARIAVRDEGPGIPEAERERVFDKFIQSSTTQTTAGGTGLGLAICREILTLHQGCIWVENGSDGGSVFVFEFPLDQQDSAKNAACKP
jgi:PAS domain S-box-containing protein